jgi:hypothetical protein
MFDSFLVCMEKLRIVRNAAGDAEHRVVSVQIQIRPRPASFISGSSSVGNVWEGFILGKLGTIRSLSFVGVERFNLTRILPDQLAPF